MVHYAEGRQECMPEELISDMGQASQDRHSQGCAQGQDLHAPGALVCSTASAAASHPQVVVSGPKHWQMTHPQVVVSGPKHWQMTQSTQAGQAQAA